MDDIKSLVQEKLIDSSIIIAACSGILYFLGVTRLFGRASALGISPTFLYPDIKDIVADGAHGLLITIFSPLYVVNDGVLDSFILGVIILFLIIFGLIYWVFRRSKYLIPVVLFCFFIFSILITSSIAENHTRAFVDEARSCLSLKPCNSHSLMAKVVVEQSKGVTVEQIGFPYEVSSNYLIMITKDGVFISPRENIKFINGVIASMKQIEAKP